MSILENLKAQQKLAETNQPLLPHSEVELKTLPEDEKYEIEKIIKKNAEQRNEIINKGTRPHLNLFNFKVDINISSTPACDIDFNSHTDFSQAELPADFTPRLIMEQGKSAGQNIYELHSKGITGKGIKIAIIDEGLSDHEEYRGKIEHYEQLSAFSTGSFHASGVVSLAVGTKCGMAPETHVYYFADHSNSNPHCGVRNTGTIPLAIKRCIEINSLLPENEKIAAISCSQHCDPTMEGFAEYEKIRLEAEQNGIDVITVGLFREKGLSFDGYNRDMNKDVNDTDNVLPLDVKYIDSRARPDWFNEDKNQRLLFPVEHRTVAFNTGDKDYAHFAIGGYSWIIPQITGLYALCKQVDAHCTLEHMWELGLKTGIKRKDLNGVAVQPYKLISELQKEKILENKRMYQEEHCAQEHQFSLSQIQKKLNFKTF